MTVQASDANTERVFSKGFAGTSWNGTSLRKMKNRQTLLGICAGLVLAASLAGEAPGEPRFSEGPSSEHKTSTADGPQAWFQKGQTALQSGDLQSAEDAFRKVLAADPTAGAAYANLGVIAMRRKQWDEALKNLKKAERLSPKMAGIRLNIGLVEFRRENYAAAIPPLQSVVRDEPSSQQARYLLGLCQVFIRDYAAAVKTLEPLWEPMSNNVMYLYVLGMAANRAGDRELDERAILRLIDIGGDTPEFHLILGKSYLQREEIAGALTELGKAEALNPQLPYLHFNLAVAYLHNANYEKSEAEFLKDIQLEPELADNYVQLGHLYWLLQRNNDGVPEFRKALEKDPKSGNAWFGLARSYLRQKKYAEASQAIDKATKLAPENQRVHFIRGQVLQRLGRKEEAAAEFAIAKKLMDKGFTEDREKLEEQYVPSPELTQLPD